MDSNFSEAIKIIRKKAKNDKDLGDVFEKMCKIFFENDPLQKQQFSKIWHYKDWSKANKNYSKSDIGIDLVAKINGSDKFCAIQCKCYQSEHTISKSDIDSFISASSTDDFERLILIDTSSQDIGINAKKVFNNLDKKYQRIQLNELQESRIDWLSYLKDEKVVLNKKKELRDHQIKAVDAVLSGLNKKDRGKLIMACGTGKTFTALNIAEKLKSKNKLILYIVPSLALMSQTVREWKNDSIDDFYAFSACSDVKVGKRKPSDDKIEISLNDLAFPATTNSEDLSKQIKNCEKNKMIVIFSTYQSIDVIEKAQKQFDIPDFDLIICDEAHRTTGATLFDEDESNFVKIHDNAVIKGKKRLYMTATPKIYGEKAKSKAKGEDIALASMDDKKIYGETLFFRGFNWAVENNLLSDYKVVILAIDETKVSRDLQKSFEDGSELRLDDATKIIGCYKALAKVGFDNNNHSPIKRALAFSQNIEISKIFESEFKNVIKDYTYKNKNEKIELNIDVKHIDGTFNADRRTEHLNWLKEEISDDQCRILSNVRCLSEGVDVPSLDAIMFLHPKKSQVDVVQSVGRVMRKAEGKDIGYVVIPVTIAPGVTPERALDNNEKYSVVWQILNALRAHDERLDSTINKIKLGEDVSDKIDIINYNDELESLTAEIDDIKTSAKVIPDTDDNLINIENKKDDDLETNQLSFEINDLSKAIKAKIVDKCGTRDYWENWANDIAKIAQTHISRLNSILVNKKSKERKTFELFLREIRDDLNPEISENDAIEMLAQHIITKPVFDTLFQGNEFVKDNAVSKAIHNVLTNIYDYNIKVETKSLEKFYDSVKRRASDIVTSKGRTTLINELYERFFKNAFPITTNKLGIVYTPVEVVDFILKSTNDVLIRDFNSSLSEKNIHILDPFAGTGTFITRLIQSKLIDKKNLKHKFINEIHCNEIVLLAYYIAGINIESVYQEIIKENSYRPFSGSVLTDTFQLYEQDRDLIADLLPDNSNRRTNQKKRDIRVIIGNPPYSAGQKSFSDDAANVSYRNLDSKIYETYVKNSNSSNKNKIYDSYIRAFRWASDRIKDEGIIGFVTNASWIDANATDGLRKCFEEEFSSIYIFNLRGNARTQGEIRRKEKGNVFGEGSRTPVAITILVKNKNKQNKKADIKYYDIGDYLTKEQKLNKIFNLKSIKNIEDKNLFVSITPDKNNDWINQTNKEFDKYISINKNDVDFKNYLFSITSSGFASARDSYAINFSKSKLINITRNMTKKFNSLIDQKINYNKINFKDKDIKWDSTLEAQFRRKQKYRFDEKKIQKVLYRPFVSTWCYLDNFIVSRPRKHQQIFPKKHKNMSIVITTGFSEFSCLMVNKPFEYHLLNTSHTFPRYIYYNDKNNNEDDSQSSLFQDKSTVVNNLNPEIVSLFKKKLNQKVTEDQIFYYVYGILHSDHYRKKFHNNLIKGMPRIPIVKYKDFMQINDIGKKLSNLHLDFDNQRLYGAKFNVDFHNNKKKYPKEEFYNISQINFVGTRSSPDKTQIKFNNYITIKDIPLEAYDYRLSGKSAIEWIMERHSVKKDDKTGFTNDINEFNKEAMKDPSYSFNLLLKIIHISVETQKLIKKIPKINLI